MDLGQHTRLDNVDHRMQSSPLGSTHSRTMSRVACKNGSSAANTIGRRWALYAISTLGEHTQSGDVGHCVRSSLLDITHDRTTLVVAWHHVPWKDNTITRHPARHSIIALGQHTRLDNVLHGMISLTLDSTHGETTSSVTCHHHWFYEKCLLTH